MVNAAKRSDDRNGTIELRFNFESEAERRIRALDEALGGLLLCDRVWSVDTRTHTDDWKRNAGAKTLITRQAVSPS
jgi:hypothetical protein